MLQVSYDAFKEFVDSQGVTQSQHVPRKTIQLAPNVETTNIYELCPFTTYNINVTAKAADAEYRPPTRITVTTQMAAPLPMVKPDFYGVNNEEEITVILPQASEEFGPISHYYLVVVPENMETKEITNPDQFLTNEVSLHRYANDRNECNVRRFRNVVLYFFAAIELYER